MNNQANIYNFNNQDYEFTIRIFNGVNDVYLTNEAWDDLYLEEDIFDWKVKGSIIINSPYNSFERESSESMLVTGVEKEKLVYKFRNDARDTIFISIKPKSAQIPGLSEEIEFNDAKWLLEVECVIYDVEDITGRNITNKAKKLFFWEKTYQMMLEKDSSFSTANTGENVGKTNIDQLDNSERALKGGEAIGELLKSDDMFKKHANNVSNATFWDKGDDKNKIFFTSSNGDKFIDNLNYLNQFMVSSEADGFQPCILKFERASKSMSPKQFSLKSVKKYFEKAGKDKAKEYQIEHFFFEEHSEDSKVPFINKSPVNSDINAEIKADQYNTIKSYQLTDLSGLDYSQNLTNYRVVSYNSANRQFNEEANKHKAEQYKEYFNTTVKNNILTNKPDDRLPFTPYIKAGLNTKTVYSVRADEVSRMADGRNRLLKFYLFSNLAICFAVQGLTLRQPGRFFGLSKLTGNNTDFDSKMEGQYFVTNVIHHFSNKQRAYQTQVTGIKTHTYKDVANFEPSDVMVIR